MQKMRGLAFFKTNLTGMDAKILLDGD